MKSRERRRKLDQVLGRDPLELEGTEVVDLEGLEEFGRRMMRWPDYQGAGRERAERIRGLVRSAELHRKALTEALSGLDDQLRALEREAARLEFAEEPPPPENDLSKG